MEAVISQSLAPRTFTLTVLGSFAGLTLLLAAVGLYGVVAHSVARRTREIGIRVALGASKSDVLGTIVARELRWLWIGLMTGLAGAVVLTRLLSGLLFGTAPTDFVTYVSVIAILTSVALVACLLPARKAVRVDPVLALREEQLPRFVGAQPRHQVPDDRRIDCQDANFRDGEVLDHLINLERYQSRCTNDREVLGPVLSHQ